MVASADPKQKPPEKIQGVFQIIFLTPITVGHFLQEKSPEIESFPRAAIMLPHSPIKFVYFWRDDSSSERGIAKNAPLLKKQDNTVKTAHTVVHGVTTAQFSQYRCATVQTVNTGSADSCAVHENACTNGRSIPLCDTSSTVAMTEHDTVHASTRYGSTNRR